MKYKYMSIIFIIISCILFNNDYVAGRYLDNTIFIKGRNITCYNYKNRPVKIYYNIPSSGDISLMPIIFIFPGKKRNSAEYLDYWLKALNNKEVMAFVFEFPKEQYSGNEYQYGGIHDGDMTMTSQKWLFPVIEKVFEIILQQTGSMQKYYDIWGHSAGAQFVHRYITFMPGAHINRVICANSGWYTLPDEDEDFPFGLKLADIPASTNICDIFAITMLIQLGERDTTAKNLNTSEKANRQGKNRLERGIYYFRQSADIARQKDCPFKWMLQQIPGVGHQAAKMAKAAANALY